MKAEVAMTSSRPYLLRALYDWIVDNGLTPHLVANAGHEGVSVPRHAVENGRIVLNVAPAAVSGLDLGNDWILFSARFGGRPMSVSFPVTAVQAIYAKENGQGMVFNQMEDDSLPPDSPTDSPPAPPPTPPRPNKRSHLKVVK